MTSGDIAIVGMACRFAGDAKSPEEFHEMLQKGKDAWSKIPPGRFKAENFKHPSNDLSGTMVRNTHPWPQILTPELTIDF